MTPAPIEPADGDVLTASTSAATATAETASAETAAGTVAADADADGSLALQAAHGDDEGDQPVPRVKERQRWIALASLLAVSVIALIAVILYLSDVVSQWEDRADELTTVNYELGAELSDAQDTVAAQTDQIDRLTAQLSTAKDRITELANETANFDDDRAYTAQQIEMLSGYASTGASVANALTRCLEAEDQLVVYLESPDQYDAAEVAAYQQSVTELCTAAKDSNTEFQKLLNG
ncbi:hypothetical protein RN607_08275 [Demequina capsici]|uniref:Uncharacterized protein n=1 Tax=Demequina capsici TaxID=3075620 RepID=A0AA96FD75_9MICO|nr:hypothetical protein [Demequina sp. PMTSA13]WNM26195.1 hypothetical protein RN607_08275 [Demequina sp. PMTSA13]